MSSDTPFDEQGEKDSSEHVRVSSVNDKTEINDGKDDMEETASFSSIDDDENDMPIFKYARLVGSLPRVSSSSTDTEARNMNNHLKEACTCGAMARVLPPLPSDGGPTSYAAPGDGMGQPPPASYLLFQASNASATSDTDAPLLAQPRCYHIMAMGFESGKICLVDATNGEEIVTPDQLAVHYSTGAKKPVPIVTVCFDSSGSFLAAANQSGLVAVFEIKYHIVAGNTVTAANNSEQSIVAMAQLTCSSVQASRISYPISFGAPTCLALDPAYKKRRGLVIGFASGQVMNTKRSFLIFGRRNDTVMYQGTHGGIQALAWRGHLLAWADASGIKVYDLESMTRVAHVDRPTGARLSLYPTLSSMKPTLLFETSQSLLVAWGDCVMSLSIYESQETTIQQQEEQDARSTYDSVRTDQISGTSPSPLKRNRHLKVAMAWELDCVACGVVPLDSDHLVVLGVVLPEKDDESDSFQDSNNDQRVSLVPPSPINESSATSLDLEVHVMSRQNGTIVFCDALSLLQKGLQKRLLSASDYSLLSSFALPRMDDAQEAEEEAVLSEDYDNFDFEVSLFQSPSNDESDRKGPRFKDDHLRWSLNQLEFDKVLRDVDSATSPNAQAVKAIVSGGGDRGVDEIDDNNSVDSDDYNFLFRPMQNTESGASGKDTKSMDPPPLMVVTSRWDAVQVRTADVDDAVDHAIAQGKHALALQRALFYRRELRRHDLADLIDEYLGALLRWTKGDAAEDLGKVTELSVRRVPLAAKTMPTLLGCDVNMWERWISVFCEIPGALFALSANMPVRDPQLPPELFGKVLRTMLDEVVAMEQKSKDDLSWQVYQQAKDHFISTVCGWGPISALRNRMEYFSYHDERRRQTRLGISIPSTNLDDAEKAILRRRHQTAVGYLEFPVASYTDPAMYASTQESSAILHDSEDSLFEVPALLSALSKSVDDTSNSETDDRSKKRVPRVILEALAELNAMNGLYEQSLKSFLLIGCYHAQHQISSLDDEAILITRGNPVKMASESVEFLQYAQVVAMIDHHDLFFCLLTKGFLFEESTNEAESSGGLFPPIIALIRLTGLLLGGDFLVEHCTYAVSAEINDSSAPPSVSDASATSSSAWQAGLPVNLVARQLSPYPKLLLWYLHRVFDGKPEVYVRFPTTAVPPHEIRELHQQHLDLYIEYAGEYRDSFWVLSTLQTIGTEDPSTPLLKFLKNVLPLGGIRPNQVRRLLEAQRAGESLPVGGEKSTAVQFPQYFALELAYVIEHYGKSNEDEANLVLELYLKGARSLKLAAFYAQRNTTFSALLWGKLLKYCLDDGRKNDADTSLGRQDGTNFGSLLEAAALSGADLAHLVTEIPEGMKIEGLRPRLIGAVTDYRLKLQMHKSASEIVMKERIGLLRELAHRSRRGMRYQVNEDPSASFVNKHASHQETHVTPRSPPRKIEDDKLNSESKELDVIAELRPFERHSRRRVSFSLPVR